MRTITIGRSSQCDIILSGGNISRVHAEISVSNGQYIYYDKSSNGSNIGGQIISNRKIIVAPGSTILLADKIPLPWDRVYALLPASGHRVQEVETAYRGGYPEIPQQEYYPSTNDKLGVGWGILAFIIPLAGWIMYFTWKDKTPNRANAAGIIGTIAFVLNIIALCA
ncbi:MAG: FHA domain-containing protein [Tannerella sp.]|jgi:hypothetical protein|nr:FHA domain-containing protein [Tannerella sp.]